MRVERARARQVRGPRNREPDGFGEAVAAGAVMLALMTSLAFVGFAWERRQARVAQAYAVDLIERLSAHGSEALIPPWSGEGTGPSAETAQATFEAVRKLGSFSSGAGGICRLKSRPAVCAGSRYRCEVEGETPAGPISATIGLCRGGTAAAWTFDALDVTLPKASLDAGNRAAVETARDGLIRYGSGPAPPDIPSPRLHRRGIAMPFIWSAMDPR